MKDVSDQKTNESRRRFVKAAVTTAYVAPLVVSMPAKALVAHTGSDYQMQIPI